METLIRVTLLCCLAGGISAQNIVLGGQILDPRGEPLAGAEISFSMLPAHAPQRSGTTESFGLAQTRHLQSLDPIAATSDVAGNWQRQLSNSEAAILTVGYHSFLMEVRAVGYAPWFRAVGGDLRSITTELAKLERLRPGKILQVSLQGGERPYRGYALIERQFRVAAGRSIWLPSMVPLTHRGRFLFAEPARVAGELMAESPTARAEDYRVSIYAIGLSSISRHLPEGNWRLQAQTLETAERTILDPDGSEATTPIQAGYVIGDRQVTLEFHQARVPLIGELAPTWVSNDLGRARITNWQTSSPIILRTPKRNEAVFDNARNTTTLSIAVLDRHGRPAPGSAVWLEDRAVKVADDDTTIYAMTDTKGVAILRNLPRGTRSLLAHHPSAGMRELRLNLDTPTHRIVMTLRAPLSFSRTPKGQPGTLLLDMGSRDDEGSMPPTEVGFITSNRRLIRQKFANRPRWIRLEGLPRGAVSLYLHSEGEPAVLIAGLLSGNFQNSPLRIVDIQTRHFRLTIRNVAGSPLRNAAISFGEGNARTVPHTSNLIVLHKADQPGRYWFEAPIHGSPLMRIHDRDGGYQDVLIPVKLNEKFLEVVIDGR